MGSRSPLISDEYDEIASQQSLELSVSVAVSLCGIIKISKTPASDSRDRKATPTSVPKSPCPPLGRSAAQGKGRQISTPCAKSNAKHVSPVRYFAYQELRLTASSLQMP